MTRRFLYGVLLFPAASVSFAAKPDEPRPIAGLRIGPETTFVSAPLNELGYPDYVAALNRRLSEGVAADENFWAAYLEILPRTAASDSYYQQLIAVPGFERACSMPSPSYLPSGTNHEAGNAQLEKAMSAPWKAGELPIIATWLESNRGCLSRVAEAALRPKAFSPLITANPGETMADVLLPHVQQTRDTARALSCRTFLALGEGRGADAWQDVLTLHRLARHLEREPFLIGNLVGVAISSIARMPTEACLVDPAASPDVLATRWKQLASIIDQESRKPAWLDSERCTTLDLTLALRSRKARPELFGELTMLSPTGSDLDDGVPKIDFRKAQEALQSMMLTLGDVNETLAFSNRFHDRMAEAVTIPDYLQRAAAIESVTEEFVGGGPDHIGTVAAAFLLGGPDAVQDIAKGSVLRQFTAAYAACNKAESRKIARSRLLHAAFAAELHFRKTGNDVADAAELEKAIREFAAAATVDLPEMKDPYTGESFHIRHEADRLIIYGVGDNGRSDGGKTFGEGEGCDDLVVILKRLP